MLRYIIPTLIAVISAPAIAQEADTIYHGGPILTMEDAQPRAEAVAVLDGAIVAVGDLSDLTALQGDSTVVVDLEGHTMLPGFVDAHGHVFFVGLQALSANMLPAPDGQVNDIPTLQSVLSEYAEAFPERVEAVNLILGFGYDDSQLAELRHPTRHDLDAVSSDIPIAIIHQSAHFGSLNTAALEVVGFDAVTEERPGGVIRRESDGFPDGVLEETAFFEALFKLLGNLDENASRAMFKAGTELVSSYGYTTAQEGRASTGQSQLMQAVASSDGIEIDVVAYPDMLIDRDFILETARPDYVDGFRVGGAKLTIDGSPQGFTAFRDRPYYDPPEHFRQDYTGYTAATPDQVFEAVDWAFANDVQVITHSNGEGASDILIGALTAATEKHGVADRRPVLIHGQFQREDQVDSFIDLDVFPSLFPMHTFYWGDWHRDRTVGPVRAENISPTQWYLKRGSIFSTHHDAPVALPDSMRVLSATVTRRSRSGDIIGPHQRVDVETALKAMTIWPAFQHFEEDAKGSIAVGKLADFVILSDDPTAVDPETLDEITIVQTIKEDSVIYDSAEVQDGHLLYKPAPGDTPTLTRFLMASAPYLAGSMPSTPLEIIFQRARSRSNDPHAALHAVSSLTNMIID